ncbi:hypothetical protein P12x_001490 [Tundrisphaera lichenicola]|uniref:hypothetical protein n=1 Tax=Tundrisphaera lichenicola TaxID=2029860 RepID=UPI003EBBFF3F
MILVPALEPGKASAQYWGGYAADPQHTCLSKVASQVPQQVLWHMPVDLNPPFSGGNLFIHYASPVITRKNTVIVTVRGTPNNPNAFQFKAVKGQNGAGAWSQALTTDYITPPHSWYPICGPTLVSGGQSLAVPGAGGTVYLRTNPDRVTGAITQRCFYSSVADYNANKLSFNSSVFICTPITADDDGNLYFGFAILAPAAGAPAKGGLARISKAGVGTYVTAAAATGDATMQKVVYNGAPALSQDGTTVYVGVNDKVNGNSGFGTGFLVALDSQTLATKGKIRLKDVKSPGNNALLPDDGSGTPTVGPDGDVYFGVLENNLGSNNYRGWLLHFSGDLATAKTPSAFGWDITPSIVPASAVASYDGSSSYLVLTKYNNYAGAGGDGQNRMAILDPNDSEIDPVRGAMSMKVVISVLGPTPDPEYGGNAVREWCVNSTAVDPFNKCAVVNSEDGNVYRWNFTTNTLTPALTLAAATGEAYTPTVIGPDGAVYAINRAVLNCCVKLP